MRKLRSKTENEACGEISRLYFNEEKYEGLIASMGTKVAELEAENARLTERRFPIMGGPSLPWQMLVPFENQIHRNHDQSLEELARRGGLSPMEVVAAMENKNWFDLQKEKRTDAECLARLNEIVVEELRTAELTVKVAELEAENATYRETLESDGYPCGEAEEYEEPAIRCGAFLPEEEPPECCGRKKVNTSVLRCVNCETVEVKRRVDTAEG